MRGCCEETVPGDGICLFRRVSILLKNVLRRKKTVQQVSARLQLLWNSSLQFTQKDWEMHAEGKWW
jgi:hypothetical protein